MMAGQDVSHLPTKPRNLPSLSRHMEDFYNLSTTRPVAFGIGVISWLSIEQYATAKRYDDFDRYFLHRVIQSLDPIYVSVRNDELKSNKAGNKS